MKDWLKRWWKKEGHMTAGKSLALLRMHLMPAMQTKFFFPKLETECYQPRDIL